MIGWMEQTFGKWLKLELTKRELSQADLAKRTGLSTGAISHYIKGSRKDPEPATMAKIAKALGVPVSEVYAAAGVPTDPSHDDPVTERILAIFDQLQGQDKERALELLGMMLEAQRKRDRLKKKS